MSELTSLPVLFNDANLVAYYRFNNGFLTTDSRGTNTLTVNSTVVSASPGIFGFCADFGNNVNNGLKAVANNLGIAGGGDASFALWVKMQNQPGTNITDTLIKHATTLTLDRNFYLNYRDAAGTKQLEIVPAGTSTTYNVDLGTTSWHHLVAIRDVTNAKGIVYLDDVQVITNATLGTATSGVNRFDVGYDEDAGQGTSMFADDVCVFSRVLTQAEVNQLFTARPGFQTRPSRPRPFAPGIAR